MLWLDRKYVLLLSSRLRNFKQKNSDTFNFACPICGDSSKDKRKSRGWIYLKKGTLRYYCHNCNDARSVQNLVKYLDPTLHAEYIKEKLSDGTYEKAKPAIENFVKPEFVKSTKLSLLKKVSQLRHDHPVKEYVDKRRIPTTFHHKLFYAPKFKTWVNEVLPGKFPDVTHDEPRLIIPFLDSSDTLFGFQGRSFSKRGVRYITIMLDEDRPKIFGLDQVDKSKMIYVFEGPIDAMFIPNSIASAGGVITSNLERVGIRKDKVVVVYDNERRNAHTVKKISKSIDDGFNVCVWPDTILEKDVNDMIMSGKTIDAVQRIIDDNTCSGLEAKLHLTIWRKDDAQEGVRYGKTHKESAEVTRQ